MPYKSHTLPNTCLCTFVVTILFELPHSFPYQFSLSSCRGWDTHSLIPPYPMIRPSILYPYPIFDGLGQHIMNHIKLCNRKQANKSRWVSLGMTYSLVTYRSNYSKLPFILLIPLFYRCYWVWSNFIKSSRSSHLIVLCKKLLWWP